MGTEKNESKIAFLSEPDPESLRDPNEIWITFPARYKFMNQNKYVPASNASHVLREPLGAAPIKTCHPTTGEGSSIRILVKSSR
jgi:hypothetical protein